MRNSYQKFLVITTLFLNFFASTNSSFAQESKEESMATSKNFKDPDLELSIEELKKKYPASLLSEKNKTYKSGEKVNIENYSNDEIKAALLNADNNFISAKSINEIPTVSPGKADLYLLMNNVKVYNEHELAVIEAACEFFGSTVYIEPKKHQIIQSFIFSSDKISHHIFRFVPIKIKNCLDASDPFEREDRN